MMWKKKTKSYYAKSSYEKEDGNKSTMYLHRLVMNAKDNEHVDHIDHDTLNNRKYNLRLVDNMENSKNRKKANKNNKTGYRNVCWISRDGVYRVQLQVNGKHQRFGDFINLEDAVRCAKYYRNKIYGEINSWD